MTSVYVYRGEDGTIVYHPENSLLYYPFSDEAATSADERIRVKAAVAGSLAGSNRLESIECFGPLELIREVRV